MKRWTLIAGLALLAAPVAAQDYGRVLASTPVVQQVGTPQQMCSAQQIVTQAPRTGAGAVVGAMAGGTLGHGLGGGSGRALATAVGVVGGAVVGDQMEGRATQVQTVRSCTTQVVYESRTVGYDVVYEFAGQQYAARMPYDPGPTVALQASPVGMVPVQAAPAYPPPNTGYGTIQSYTTYIPPPPAQGLYRPSR